ncbi:SWIM-type domain-containing protein OS=Streptomyces glaucescens OX=1907 GN=SGLAU_01055 PE=4 SV=1 [Streptomyces glaucescens]
MFDAAAAVLEAGTDGAGAVLQAELLRAAHTARLAGLPRAADAAVAVIPGCARPADADPAYRLADLAGAVRDVLGVAHRCPAPPAPDLVGLWGTARQPYRPDGSLRLYGLFFEPVLTATGYAGAVTWTADADRPPPHGLRRGAGRRGPRAGRRRPGRTDRRHRPDAPVELSRAGLAVSGATVSADGAAGRGAGVRAGGVRCVLARRAAGPAVGGARRRGR